MIDRSGQVWEFDYEMCFPLVQVVYIVLASRAVIWDGKEGTQHTFLSTFDDTAKAWWEEHTPFESHTDRRRLA